MGKYSMAEEGILRADELSLDGVENPSAELRRAWDDYRRLREAMEWLQALEPDNDVALAMIGRDLSRREATFRAALARAGVAAPA